jgi:hypothetical protein
VFIRAICGFEFGKIFRNVGEWELERIKVERRKSGIVAVFLEPQITPMDTDERPEF